VASKRNGASTPAFRDRRYRLAMTLQRRTRKNILDWMSVERAHWSGRLDEDQFLARMFDLDELPSTDTRYETAAGDIWQHRVNNNDWPDDWVFNDPRFNLLGCSEEAFLLFLSEMIHPVVRQDAEEAQGLADAFNDLLREDGYELVARTKIAGRPVWAGQRRSLQGAAALPALRGARQKFDADYILRQITRMEIAIEDDPGLAIGTSKGLLETTCKAILDLRGRPAPPGRPDLPKLVRAVTEELDLLPDGVSTTSREPETVKRILGSLAIVASGGAELRNAYGTGHGRAPSARGLNSRHARLAVGAASTLAVFLFETHLERPVVKPDG
jgi:hypothetical protein